MTEKFITLYHVSPSYNLASILKEGVSPYYSRGAKRVSWWTTHKNLMWAIAHISRRYAMSANTLVVFSADIPELLLLKTRWCGIYNLTAPRRVIVGKPASAFIDDHEEQLALEERVNDILRG